MGTAAVLGKGQGAAGVDHQCPNRDGGHQAGVPKCVEGAPVLDPMAGYYEWSVSAQEGKKDPWFIHAAMPLWAAGLWEDASKLLPEGNLGTFTVITGDSSGVSADIHDRMPVWLSPGQAEAWLKADADADDAMAMLLASEPPAMEAYRVSRAVNTPRNNTEQLLQPVA